MHIRTDTPTAGRCVLTFICICVLLLPLPLLSQECHCMLFLTEDNDFAGQEQEITMQELRDGISGTL